LTTAKIILRISKGSFKAEIKTRKLYCQAIFHVRNVVGKAAELWLEPALWLRVLDPTIGHDRFPSATFLHWPLLRSSCSSFSKDLKQKLKQENFKYL